MRAPKAREAVAGIFTLLGAASSGATLLQYMNVPPEQLGGLLYQSAPVICLLGGFTAGASISYLVTRRSEERKAAKALAEAEAKHAEELAQANERTARAESERDEALSNKVEREKRRDMRLADSVRHMPLMAKVLLVGLLDGDDGVLIGNDDPMEGAAEELGSAGLALWETASGGKRWRATSEGHRLSEMRPDLLNEAWAEYEAIRREK